MFDLRSSGFDGIFYPATGEECHRKRPEILNVPLDKQGIQSYRTAFTDLVLPALLRFKPGKFVPRLLRSKSFTMQIC